MAEHTTTLPDPAVTARSDYDSWKGVVPADVARRRAQLLASDAEREYWAAYAAEVERLQAPQPNAALCRYCRMRNALHPADNTCPAEPF